MLYNMLNFWFLFVKEYNFAKMKSVWLYLIFSIIPLTVEAHSMTAEGYYVHAFNEMSDMLAGRDTLSIKRAVFLAEWAFYEGNLDYKTDFCNEIDRITTFIQSLYEVNKLQTYKTGMQMAISSYMVSPYSGNGYTPYTYDFETFSMDKEPWERQFVSRTLKTHKGQCRSLSWLYKILANELNADAALAQAPPHTYIMYKDEDNITPEDQQALVDMVVNTINSDDIHKVEYLTSGKDMSRTSLNAFSPRLNLLGITSEMMANMPGGASSFVKALCGEASTVPIKSGSFTIILKTPDAFVTNRPATLGHEIIGHGRSLRLGYIDLQSQHILPIQVENLILRNMGIKTFRNGTDHAPLNIFIPNYMSLPSFR